MLLLRKNLNAAKKPPEQSKDLGGNIACKDKNSPWYLKGCLKKNQNAPRPSENPPVRGEKMQRSLGGIIGCKYKTSPWHLHGFSYGSNIGPTVKCRGEAHRYSVHLH